MRPSSDHQGDGITIAEAARVLGVSENAIRQRIKRKSIEASKLNGVWRIWLDDQEPSQSDDHDGDHQPDYQATTSQPGGDQEATNRTVAINPAALAQLEAIRIEWLQPLVNQLNEKSTQIGRLEERLSATETARDAALQDAEHLRTEIEALRTPGEANRSPEKPVDERTLGEVFRPESRPTAAGSPDPDESRPLWKRLLGIS
jgi:hypothetical protein